MKKFAFLFAMPLLLTSCGCNQQPAVQHVHTFSEEWSYNGSIHWHAATCEHTDQTSGAASHVWGDWVIITPATVSENGTRRHTCSVCEYTAEESYSFEKFIYTLMPDGQTYSIKASTTELTGELEIPSFRSDDFKKIVKIDKDGFKNCTGITKIASNYSILDIGDNAFEGCTGLTEVNFRANPANEIGEYAFKNCSNLVTANINGFKVIGKAAFIGCSSLTNVTLLNTEIIGDSAFGGCPLNNSFKLPTTITRIGIEAFKNCANLKTTTVDECIYLGAGFNSMFALIDTTNYMTASTFTLNVNTKVIGGWAFRKTQYLKKLTVPSDLISIGYGAFNTRLTHIECSGSYLTDLCYIGNNAFEDLTTFPEIRTSRDLTVDYMSFCLSAALNSFVCKTTDGGSITIGDQAFSDSKIRNVTLGAGLKKIDVFAFYNCPNLTAINFDGTMEQWGQVDLHPCWRSDETDPENPGILSKIKSIICSDGTISLD